MSIYTVEGVEWCGAVLYCLGIPRSRPLNVSSILSFPVLGVADPVSTELAKASEEKNSPLIFGQL